MVPTKRGAAMLVVGLVVYGLAWYTHIGWYYLANALVWAVVLVNLPLPWLSTRRLSAGRRLVSRVGGVTDVFEDDTVTVEVELRNRSFLPRFMISLREHCPLAAPGDEERGFLFGMLGPRGRVRTTYDLSCYKRGVYTFGPLQAHTSAPFGLFRSRRRVEAPLDVTVYPKALPMQATFGPGHLQGRLPHTGPPALGGEFRGSREYQTGDHYRSIHWRNSARQAKLMVKEFDQLPQGEVTVAFETALDLGDGKDTTLEYSIKIAASLARRAFRDGRPFRMWPRGRDEFFPTWHAVLEHLAGLETGPEAWVAQMLGRRDWPGVGVVVASAADSETLALLAGNSSSFGGLVAVVLEEFGENEDPDAARGLARSGLDVVSCRPGQLEAALASLDSAMGVAGAEPGTRHDRTGALASG